MTSHLPYPACPDLRDVKTMFDSQTRKRIDDVLESNRVVKATLERGPIGSRKAWPDEVVPADVERSSAVERDMRGLPAHNGDGGEASDDFLDRVERASVAEVETVDRDAERAARRSSVEDIARVVRSRHGGAGDGAIAESA